MCTPHRTKHINVCMYMYTNIYFFFMTNKATNTEKLSFMGELCKNKLWFFWTPFDCSRASGFSCQKNKLSRLFFRLIGQGFSKSMTFQVDFTPMRFEVHGKKSKYSNGTSTHLHILPTPLKKPTNFQGTVRGREIGMFQLILFLLIPNLLS